MGQIQFSIHANITLIVSKSVILPDENDKENVSLLTYKIRTKTERNLIFQNNLNFAIKLLKVNLVLIFIYINFYFCVKYNN